MKNSFFQHIVLAFLIVLLTACGATKTLQENEKLLYATSIKVDKPQAINQDDLSTNILQKPNRRLFFFFPTYLWVYNLFDQEKLEKRNERKKEKLEIRNKKRKAKGKNPKEFKPVLGHRIKYGIGEEPVIVDSTDTQLSINQLDLYLKQNGYYRAKINVESKEKGKKKVKLIYHIKVGEPTLITAFQFKIEDYNVFKNNSEVVNGSLLKKQTPLNIEKLEKERDRVTKAMRNKGYYYFSSDYVSFEVDTFQVPKTAEVKELIENPYTTTKTDAGIDTLTLQKHKQYTIGKIFINAAYNPKYESRNQDSIHVDGYIFTNVAQLRYKPKMLLKSIFIKPGSLFSLEAQEYTYRRLNALRNFKFINIRYVEGDNQTLDCYINLTPSLPQSFSLESEGTNTGGNLGIAGNLNYAHRNIFKGTESLNIRLRGGFESQPTSNTSSETDDETTIGIGDVDLFNTIEYGIDFSLNIPELLIPKRVSGFSLPKYNNPKTIFNLNFNFQRRPDYTRGIINGSMAYQWSAATERTNLFTFQPIGVSLIQIENSPSFQARLDSINNPFYTSTYSDQLIVGSKLTHTWTNQNLKKESNFVFNRAHIETAGNALNLISSAIDSEPENDYYSIDSIRFAQFVKLENDLRLYNIITKNTKMVYRIYAGVGIPYGNASVLPFDKSFFAGGSNDIRAWRARSLGPGSLPDSLKQGIDQVGDILIEFNLEYRYKLTKTVEGALFADIGNIWLHSGNNREEQAEFDVSRFYKEFAVGLGTGLRFDFSFLLLRLDLGFQIHDPAQATGERWIFEPKTKYNSVHNSDYTLQYTLNLGIDYPF